MFKRILPIICLVFAISACGPTTTEAPGPTYTPPPTLPPPSTPPPTSTPDGWVLPAPPTPSAAAAFAPHGPLLTFVYGQKSDSKTILYDPVRGTRTELKNQLSGDVLGSQIASFSPDLRYLAYYTGILDDLTDPLATPPEPQHVELNIQRTADGTVVFRTELLNPEYPHNFPAAADALLASPPTDFDNMGSSRTDIVNELWGTFQNNLFTNTWSNHGHVLAFASGAGGPSSDVYTYDVDTAALTRITDGPSEVYQIYWSPDDQWILNSGIYWEGEGMCGTWYASAPDGSASYAFKVGGLAGTDPVRGCYFGGWVSDTQALVSEAANGMGTYNLELMDIRQHTLDLLWPHRFTYFTFDPVSQKAYVAADGQELSGNSIIAQGTYRVDVATQQATVISPQLDSLAYLGWPNMESVVGINSVTSEYCFLPSMSCGGLADSAQKPDYRLTASNDRQYLAIGGTDGVWLVTPGVSGNNITQIFNSPVYDVSWSPNPGADLANDWLLLTTQITPASYILINLSSGQHTPLTGLDGYSFTGWLP